jgi:PKD repeat protein
MVSFAQFGGDADSQWDFGDGVVMRGAAAARKFTTPGIYNVEVVCNGKKGTVAIEVEGKTKKARRSRNK